VKLGIGIASAQNVAEFARGAEDAGFDSVHCGEHFFFHGPTPHALVTLAVAAGATRRIRLLSAVTLAPLYPAVAIAKMATTLDIASGGRLDLGLGLGGEFPAEFAAAGVPVTERSARTDEALHVLRALFSGERVTYRGRWAQLADLRLDPRPAQPGGPKLWLAGRRGAALRRAGRYADVWMPYMVTPQMFADGLVAVRAAAVESGRKPDAVDGALFAFVSVDPDGVKARRWAEDRVGATYRQDGGRLAAYLVAGAAAECTDRLREFEQAGASSAQLTLACPPSASTSMLRLLADEVLPASQSPVSTTVRTP